jgi:hypothetical protein
VLNNLAVAMEPPRSAVMPASLQTVLLVATVLAALAVAGWAVVRLVRFHDPIPLFVAVGTQIAAPYEALGDAMLHVYYPEIGQIGWLESFGRRIPLFVQLLYLPYIVPFVAGFTAAARARLSRAAWWRLWVGTLVATAAMEVLVLAFGKAWIYYGEQPAVVLGLPLWVTLTNVTFLFAIGSTVVWITRRVPRRHWWTITPATAFVLAAGHAVVAAPGSVAIEAADGPVTSLLGAAGSLGIAVVIAWALSLRLTRTADSHQHRSAPAPSA